MLIPPALSAGPPVLLLNHLTGALYTQLCSLLPIYLLLYWDHCLQSLTACLPTPSNFAFTLLTPPRTARRIVLNCCAAVTTTLSPATHPPTSF